MKRVFIFRTILALTMVLLSVNGLFAQVADNAYSAYDVAAVAPANVDYVTLQAGGSTTMGYYALPDPTYHSNYNAGGGWALTAGFVWNWTLPTNPGGAGSISYPVAAKPANYVQITYTATGNYVANVTEEAPAAMGGCTGSPVVMNVTVVSPPVVTITTGDPAQACGNQPLMAVAMTFTEAVPAAYASYAFAVNETVENIDAAGVVIGAALVNNSTFVSFPAAGKLKSPALTGAASPYGYSFNTSVLTVQNARRTRYTYTLIKASDAPGAAANGVISAISQKSDFISGTVNTYPFGAKSTLVAIVNPAPVTGPIYHIPNTYAY